MPRPPVMLISAFVLAACLAAGAGIDTTALPQVASLPGSSSAARAAVEAWTAGRWTRVGRAEPSAPLRVVVAVACNTSGLAQSCIDVSDPKSVMYGKYMSLEQVASRVAAAASEAAVLAWLAADTGVTSVSTVATHDYVVAYLSVAAVERLFRVRMDVFRHPTEESVVHVASVMPYTVPATVSAHVALVLGVSEVPPNWSDVQQVAATNPRPNGVAAAMTPSIVALVAADSTLWLVLSQPCVNNTQHSTNACGGGANANPVVAYEVHAALNCSAAHVVAGNVTAANSTLNGNIVLVKFSQGIEPNQFYNVSVRAIPKVGPPSMWSALAFNWTSLPSTYRGVVVSPTMSPSFTRKYYGTSGSDSIAPKGSSQAGVEFFREYFAPADVNMFLSLYNITSEANITVVGPNSPAAQGLEAQMDIELMLGMAPNVDMTFWSVKMTNTSTIVPNFMLEWALQMNNASVVPLVNSISYGLPERLLSTTYLERSNTEFIKLCLRGVSVIVCSQDAGATGNGHSTRTCDLTPMFPAVSPWVTTVGSTVQLLAAEPRSNGMLDEAAVSVMNGKLWTSGGGFAASPVNRRVAYQDAAVSAYLQSSAQCPPAKSWNASGRAYPDVAAIGTNYDIVFNGHSLPLGDGTSSSTPVFAAMTALLNNVRLAAGKPPLGFLNPLLYHLAANEPVVFYDVVIGSNECGQLLCCPYGYQCAAGFDAVTGLGSVGDFEKLQAAVMNM